MTLFAKKIQNPIRVLATVLGVAIASTALTSTPVAAETIHCPMSQIRREVTTPLPSGWWNTPIVNSLQETKIITIAGKKTMQCRYGTAGSIMHKVARNKTCTAIRGGFRCESARASSPRTIHTGSTTVRQTYTTDFDGSSSQRGDADLWFQAETRELLYLAPQNGAKFGVGNRRNRGYAGCSSARYTRDRVSLRDIPVGSYICVKTNEGRISQFRVNEISAGSPKTITLGFTTFE